jgi:hypothetical protein
MTNYLKFKNILVIFFIITFFSNTAFPKIIGENIRINIPKNFYTYEFSIKQLTSTYPFLKEDFIIKGIKENYLDLLFDQNTQVILVSSDRKQINLIENILKDYQYFDKNPKYKFIVADIDMFLKSFADNDVEKQHSVWISILKKFEIYESKSIWIIVGTKQTELNKSVDITKINNALQLGIEKEKKNFFNFNIIDWDVSKNYYDELMGISTATTGIEEKRITKFLFSFKNSKAIFASLNCFKDCSYVDDLFDQVLSPSYLFEKSYYGKNNSANTNIAYELERLQKLLNSGAITKDEYQKAKNKVLK